MTWASVLAYVLNKPAVPTTGVLLAQLVTSIGTGLSSSLGTGIMLSGVAVVIGIGLSGAAAGVYLIRNCLHRRKVAIIRKKK